MQLSAALLVLLLLGFVAARPLLARLAPRAQRLPRIGSAASDYFLSLHEILGDRRRLILLATLAGVFWLLQYLSLWSILVAGGAAVDLPAAAVVAGAAILGGTLSLMPLGTQDGISAVVLRAYVSDFLTTALPYGALATPIAALLYTLGTYMLWKAIRG